MLLLWKMDAHLHQMNQKSFHLILRNKLFNSLEDTESKFIWMYVSYSHFLTQFLHILLFCSFSSIPLTRSLFTHFSLNALTFLPLSHPSLEKILPSFSLFSFSPLSPLVTSVGYTFIYPTRLDFHYIHTTIILQFILLEEEVVFAKDTFLFYEKIFSFSFFLLS